jgi:hypothetical protein
MLAACPMNTKNAKNTSSLTHDSLEHKLFVVPKQRPKRKGWHMAKVSVFDNEFDELLS